MNGKKKDAEIFDVGHRKRVGVLYDWDARVHDWSWRWACKQFDARRRKIGKIRRIKPPWKVDVGP
jgi:hypothetical protein